MAKYGDEDEALKGAGLGDVSPPAMYRKRYPGQTRPLPSDEESIMESNKDRQDRAMKNALEKIGMAISPAATAGMLAAKELQRKRRSEGGVTSDGMKKGGKVSSASKRADGIAQRGKTRGRFV